MAHMRLFAKAFGKFRPISSAHTVKICEKKEIQNKSGSRKTENSQRHLESNLARRNVVGPHTATNTSSVMGNGLGD